MKDASPFTDKVTNKVYRMHFASRSKINEIPQWSDPSIEKWTLLNTNRSQCGKVPKYANRVKLSGVYVAKFP